MTTTEDIAQELNARREARRRLVFRMNTLILLGAFGLVMVATGATIRQISPEVLFNLRVRPELSYLYSPLITLLGAVTTLFSALYYYLSFGFSHPRKVILPRDIEVRVRPLPEATEPLRNVDAPSAVRPLRSNRALMIERSIVSRLRDEIRQQGRRSNINLSAGIITAALGVAILVWLSTDAIRQSVAPQSKAQVVGLQMHDISQSAYWAAFLSRSLISITCNIFAFFFLSTYRRNLSEVRYFQNELTNIQAKLLALALTTDANMKGVRSDILKRLSEVERNFILRKGETTVDLGIKGLDQKEVEGLSEMLGRAAIQFADRAKLTSETKKA